MPPCALTPLHRDKISHVAEYAIRRINGQKLPEVQRTLEAVHKLHDSVTGLMRLLEPMDFELLVDLAFSDSGWRRLGVVGRTQKTIDLDILLPSTGERAFVQVKSRALHRELKDYAEAIDQAGPYDRMFFVFQIGEVTIDDERVTVIGPDRFAEMVVEAGLTSWLLRKVS